jgi:phosphoribosylaminoimidazole carboxylase PurE protein
MTRVLVLIGSESDAPIMRGALDVLAELGVSARLTVASAHRSPARVERIVDQAVRDGVQVFIAAAGAAAHLAGVVASRTTRPVIGVPIDSSPLGGFDALLSTVQMPPGVPVATVSVGKPGAINAAVLAAQILALSDGALAGALEQYKRTLANKVEEAARKVEAELEQG